MLNRVFGVKEQQPIKGRLQRIECCLLLLLPLPLPLFVVGVVATAAVHIENGKLPMKNIETAERENLLLKQTWKMA